MEIMKEEYRRLVEAKTTLDLLGKLYASLKSYQFDDVCKEVFPERAPKAPKEANDAE